MTGLSAALGVEPGDVVCVVGAGGKSTLIDRLAAEWVASGRTALVTCTTHTGAPSSTDGLFFDDAPVGAPPPDGLTAALGRLGRATVLGRRLRDDKLQGIAPERVDALRRTADVVLVEADGARGRSLKLPADHEPVVPRSTTLFVVVAGIDVLGEPFDERRVHRFDRAAAACGQVVGEPITEATVATILGASPGYPDRVRAVARSVVFLNRTESPALEEAASRLALRLIPPYDRVVAGSARDGRGWRLA